MFLHDPNSPEPYLRPVYPFRNKLKRAIWSATWFMLCYWTPIPLHAWRVFVLRLFGASIGQKNAIYPTCKIWAPWLLETENIVSIGPGAEIYNPGGVRLEHHAIVSQYAYICGATHNYNSPEFSYLKKKIVLKPYTWICAHCGEGSVLGAAAVATHNLQPWTVYAGNPAQVVKERHNFLVESAELLH